jgi:hypothetical protein
VSRRILIESAGGRNHRRYTHQGNSPATCQHARRLA